MTSPETSLEKTLTFFKLFSGALPPLRADKSALGMLPVAAYQYCEAVRVGSAYGWYIFPPVDIRLRFNGVDTYFEENGEWVELSKRHLTDDFVEEWNRHAPDDLKGYWPPFMTALFVPGIVQIWSGILLKSAPGWSTMIGAPPNIPQSRHYSCFEGIVETDSFSPMPLFINIQLHASDREILIPKNKPLFAVRPLLRVCHTDDALQCTLHEGFDSQNGHAGGMTPENWAGYAGTIRMSDRPAERRTPGSYGAARRKEKKRARAGAE